MLLFKHYRNLLPQDVVIDTGVHGFKIRQSTHEYSAMDLVAATGAGKQQWDWGGCRKRWVWWLWWVPDPISLFCSLSAPFSLEICAKEIALTCLRRHIVVWKA